MGKLDLRTTLGYVTAQLSGAHSRGVPLLAWGAMGRSVAFGATLPGEGYAIETVLLGEVITTFAMVTLLCVFLGFRRMRPFTPALFPSLYAVMVYAESPISGTSTNPARSLGPAIVSGHWDGLVDLLGRSGDRQSSRHAWCAVPREANHGREVVSLRQRPRQAVSQDAETVVKGHRCRRLY